MIVYTPLWKTMEKRGITQYTLIHQYHFSSGQLSRLRKNESVTVRTLDTLCDILQCDLKDVAVRITENKK